jgi:hypothetical protein
MASALNDTLGQLHIVTGKVTVSSAVWTMTSNDGSATLSDLGAGNVRVNFVDPFLTAPTVVASVLKGTHEAAVVKSVMVESVTTTTAEFVCHSIDDTGTGATDLTTADPDTDDGFHFIAIGLRNN